MPKDPQHASTDSPTLPLPPPRAAVTLDQFLEAATTAALRAVDQHSRQVNLDPVTLRRPIWVGIVIDPNILHETPLNAAPG